ncbi:MAG: hypothetical protein CMJ52_01145 [Planctomycetaceae bacterium]|nr:hypothetical protein [Planctomycetaceae bacterium]
MRLLASIRRTKRLLLAFHREEKGIESLEWMMSALVLCGIIIYFAAGLTDPLVEMLFEQLDTVNPN